METRVSLKSLSTTSSCTTKSMNRIFTVKPVPKSDDKERRATDKYWCIFFVVVFISWIVSWHYANIHHRIDKDVLAPETDYIIIPDDSADAKNSSGFFLHEAENTTNSGNGTATEKKKMKFSELLYLYVYIFTFDLSHIDKYIEKMGNFLIVVHAINSIGFLHISLLSIRRNKTFSKQPSIIGAAFIFIALIEHLSKMFHSSSNSVASPLLAFHEKLTYWVIPEIMFLIIWLSKTFSAVNHGNKDDEDFCAKTIPQNFIKNSIGDDACMDSIDDNDDDGSDYESADDVVNNGSGNSSDDNDFMDGDDDVFNDGSDNDDIGDDSDNQISRVHDCNDDPDDASIPFHYYIYAIIFGFPFVIVLKLLMMSTITVLYKIGSGSTHFYVIAGGSFYIGLTVYYFALMLTACATNILIDRKNFTLDDLQRALYIISRYHFGTACYHATLIFPRLHATLVMNESEFRIWARLPMLKERFDMTHRQVYGLSRTIIAARGHNHADSIRELLRLFTTVCVKKEYFRNFKSTMTKSLLVFLLTINCLAISLLWAFGTEDPYFAKSTWVMYITIMFMYYMVMPFFKTVSETIGLRLSGRQVNYRGPWGGVYSKTVSLL